MSPWGSCFATARGRYHLFPGSRRGVVGLDERLGVLRCLFGVGGKSGGGEAAAFGGRGGPQGRPPACQTKERARGLWPRVRSFRALRAQPPPPA